MAVRPLFIVWPLPAVYVHLSLQVSELQSELARAHSTHQSLQTQAAVLRDTMSAERDAQAAAAAVARSEVQAQATAVMEAALEEQRLKSQVRGVMYQLVVCVQGLYHHRGDRESNLYMNTQ